MAGTSDDVRSVARKRIEERRGFVPHLVMFLVINAGLVIVWASTGQHGFFWPIFPIVFWGAGLLMHAWNAYVARPITEDDVDREVRRLRSPD